MSECPECRKQNWHKMDCSKGRRFNASYHDYYDTTESAWQGSSKPSETGDGSGSFSGTSQDSSSGE